MPASFLIIDGYNLLHAAGMARRRYGPGDLERCRYRFLKHLAKHLPSRERRRTTVVFDAGDAPGDTSRESVFEEITVVFAVPGGDADSLIESLIRTHSAPRQVRVISSDHRLQKAARRRRARFVDSETFLAELESRGAVDEDVHGPAAAPGAAPGDPLDFKTGKPLPSGELDKWLDEFGDVPEADRLDSDVDRWLAHMDELDRLLDDDDSPGSN